MKIVYVGPANRKARFSTGKVLEFKNTDVEVTGLSDKEVEYAKKFTLKGKPVFKIVKDGSGKTSAKEV